MQAADDVKFGDGLRVARSGGLECLFQRHGVGAGSVLLAAEGTEAAGGNANVGWVDVPVDVEVSHIPVHSLAHMIGQPAQSKDVRRAVKRNGIIKGEALAREDLLSDRVETRVVGLECMPVGS